MFSIEIQLDNDDLPEDWTDENIIDFINQLLARKKKKRLGYKSGLDVKNHPYFKDIPWSELENMSYVSPFVFETEDNFDDSYAQKQDNDSIYDGNKDLYIFEVNNSSFFPFPFVSFVSASLFFCSNSSFFLFASNCLKAS